MRQTGKRVGCTRARHMGETLVHERCVSRRLDQPAPLEKRRGGAVRIGMRERSNGTTWAPSCEAREGEATRGGELARWTITAEMR
eukprot:104336-Prymnesium_polylepis.1